MCVLPRARAGRSAWTSLSRGVSRSVCVLRVFFLFVLPRLVALRSRLWSLHSASQLPVPAPAPAPAPALAHQGQCQPQGQRKRKRRCQRQCRCARGRRRAFRPPSPPTCEPWRGLSYHVSRVSTLALALALALDLVLSCSLLPPAHAALARPAPRAFAPPNLCALLFVFRARLLALRLRARRSMLLVPVLRVAPRSLRSTGVNVLQNDGVFKTATGSW